MAGKQRVATAIFSQHHHFLYCKGQGWAGGLGTRLNVLYMRYIACTNNLRSSIGVMCV